MANEVPALGRDQRFYVNTGVESGDGSGTFLEIDLATDVTIGKSKDLIELANRGAARLGWKIHAVNTKGYIPATNVQIPAEGETANVANDIVIDAFYSDDIIEIVNARGDINTGTAVEATFARVYVGGGDEEQPLDNAVEMATEFPNAAIPLRGHYTSGVFTPLP